MIQATKEHHLTFYTTDERTNYLVNTLHNMADWLEDGIMSEEVYFHVHNILRNELETENLLLVNGYIDNREEGEYKIRVIEFPVKADGEIHTAMYTEEGKYYLPSQEDMVELLIEDTKAKLKGEK